MDNGIARYWQVSCITMPGDVAGLPDLKLVASVATNIYYDVTKTN